MRQAQVSVIVPTYNSSAYLAPSVESIRQQEGILWELLLVDDASEDNTLAVAKLAQPDKFSGNTTYSALSSGNAPPCPGGIRLLPRPN